jgi:two-component system nitrate/nitrite response regulator NarL
MAGPPITVLAADHQPLYRDAIARVVRQQPELELVGEVADGRAALAAIEARRPAVAVLGAGLPDLGGQRVLDAIVRDGLPTRVVLMAAHMTPGAAYHALARGATGCLTTTAAAEHVRAAILAAARGRTYLGAEIQSALAAELRARSACERPLLSRREAEVLRRVADGRSGPAIARELQIGEATVKTHLAHLYEKLEVSERAAAVAAAMRRGLLE